MLSSPQSDSLMMPRNRSGVSFKQYLRKLHILENLYRSGSMTVPDISRRTHISAPTTSKLLDDLIADQFVQDQGPGPASSGGGPRPRLYGLRPESRFILGIDIGRKTAKMAIINICNEMVTAIETYPVIEGDELATVKSVHQQAEILIQQSGIDRDSLIGVGIGLPGLVDAETGRSFTYYDFPDTTVQETFVQLFAKPVVVENDARVMTLGEHRFGLAQGRDNVLCLNVGWGVGMGMILNGKLYRGHEGFAGEFGHIRILPDGLLCHCGKQGCLETMASGTALTRLAREGLAAGKLTRLQEMVSDNLDLLEASQVVDAARAGDQYAISILAEIGKYLGQGLAVIIHLLNPDLIILGGRVSKAEQYILDPIKQALNQHSIARILNHTEICISTLQDRSGVMGAAALILEKVFDDTRNVNIPIF